MINALPYIFLIIIYGGLSILHKYFQKSPKKRNYINILSVVIFVIFFGLRGFIAYDWVVYYSVFHETPTISKLLQTPYIQWTIEPGFLILVSLCKTIYPNNYIFFQAICTTLNILLITHFLKKYTYNIPICLIIFIAMGGRDFSLDIIRNSISIAIFINGIEFLEKRKIIPYTIICLIAASFHNSALIYIPMYFVLNRNFNRYILISIFVAANVICILHIPLLKNLVLLFANLLSPSAALYIDTYMSFDKGTTSLFGIGYLERLLTGILVLCYLNKLRNLRKSNVLINSMFFYLFINLFLSEFRTISTRCSYLFVYAYWIIWIDLYKCLYYKSNKIIYIICIGFYCIIKTYSGNNDPMYQYYNVLFDQKSHNERILYFRKNQNKK